MKKKYGILIVILLFIVLGAGASIINRFYSFDYLYDMLIKREFSVNPRAKILPDKNYPVTVWYQPFLRTIEDGEQEKEFFRQVLTDLHHKYPNIELKVRRLDFFSGREELMKSLKEGNPPDIYFNLSNDSLIDPDYQIPVESFLSSGEKAGFYTVDWNKEHLWGWPLMVQRQCWIANKEMMGIDEEEDFVKIINKLDKEQLLLNYYDPTLLRQLLSLTGLDRLQLKDNKLTEDSYQALKEVFSWLHYLQKKQAFALSVINMEEEFLKKFFADSPLIFGPVNPWMEKFLINKGGKNLTKINIHNLIQLYTLSIFHQKKYLGDDHTRAVMELARVISEDHSTYLAEKMGLEPVYRDVGVENSSPEGREFHKILEITPEVKEYWEGRIIPAWIEFWETGLTPEEVMARF